MAYFVDSEDGYLGVPPPFPALGDGKDVAAFAIRLRFARDPMAPSPSSERNPTHHKHSSPVPLTSATRRAIT